MFVTRYLGPLLIIGLCFDCVACQSTETDSNEKTVVEAIKHVRSLPVDSVHVFLREATLAVSSACNHKSWGEVTTAIDKQMCPVVFSRKYNNTLDQHYLVRSSAVALPNGQSLDAYISISRKEDSKGPTAKAFHGRVVLFDEINAKSKAVKKNRYPKDTVLDIILRSDEITREMKRWSYMKSVYLSYEPIIRREGVYYGFAATVEFAESLDKNIGGKRLYFLVSSGLGPAYDKIPDGFDQRDTLGGLETNGSSEWGVKLKNRRLTRSDDDL